MNAEGRMLQLVEALERVTQAMDGSTLEQLAELVKERHEILTLIQSTDAASLSPEVQKDVRARIDRVIKLNDELLAAVIQARDNTKQELDKLGSVRRGLTGYKSGPTSSPIKVDRQA